MDGKVAGFEVDIALHYEVARAFGAEALRDANVHLVSRTPEPAKT